MLIILDTASNISDNELRYGVDWKIHSLHRTAFSIHPGHFLWSLLRKLVLYNLSVLPHILFSSGLVDLKYDSKVTISRIQRNCPESLQRSQDLVTMHLDWQIFVTKLMRFCHKIDNSPLSIEIMSIMVQFRSIAPPVVYF